MAIDADTDPRFAFDDKFAEFFMGLDNRAYDLLPDEFDDADLRRVVEQAIAEFEEREGSIDWSPIPASLLLWFNPVNIYTFTDSLNYLPEDYVKTLTDLPAEVPADVSPYREALIQGVIAHLKAYAELMGADEEVEEAP